MIELSVKVPEVKEFINDIANAPGKIFDMLRLNVRETVGKYLTALMEAELTIYLGRERYKRQEERKGYRNGGYKRDFTLKGIGEITVKVPRDREGNFKTKVLPKCRQYEDTIREDLVLLYLSGVSDRCLSMLSKRLIGRKISHAEVSKASAELTEGIEAWRTRDLSQEPIKYLFIDGVNFSMRVDNKVEKVPFLVVIGVMQEKGIKKVLAIQAGDKESCGTWRELFKDLKSRGIDGSQVTLGVMDGLPGLEMVFKEEFPQAKTQRCQVHVARNVLAKVPKSTKKEVADDMRSIFYASSKEKALGLFESFKGRWDKIVPSAVKCLDRSIESCLTFFDFPEDEWISLRTTNIIERLNKEFKRRTKPMEIVAGENACYKLLAFISLKMELHWRSNPVGKVNANLPLYKQLAEFTQNS
ncbi:MAG: IS256 family transposase [PVC group bacterium]|nr:IS256 family transposase [PVC group bacterium]